MKILKEKSREYKGKIYYKYKINIPEVILRSCGFKEGEELEVENKLGSLLLKKKQHISN